MRPKGFEPLPPRFAEAYSKRRKSLENKEFWHSGCAIDQEHSLADRRIALENRPGEKIGGVS